MWASSLLGFPMILRILLTAAFLLQSFTLHAQTLDWAVALPSATGPLPVEVTATSIVSDGSVVVAGMGETLYGTSSSRRKRIVAKVSAEGELMWRTELPETPESGVSRAATDMLETTAGDLLLVASSSLLRISLADGSVVWVRNLPGSSTRLQRASSEHVFALGSVQIPDFPFPLTAAQVLKVSAVDGSIDWEYRHDASSTVTGVVGASTFANGDLVVALANRELLRIDAISGLLDWRLAPVSMPAPAFRKLLVDADDRIVDFHGGQNGGLALRSGSDGALIWQASSAAGLESSLPAALFLTEARVLAVSQPTEGYAQGEAATRVPALQLEDGASEWQTTPFAASSGARYVRGVALTDAPDQLAVLLSPSAQRASLTTPVAPGRRVLLVSAIDGSLSANVEIPGGSDLIYADDLRGSSSGQLKLMGARTIATGLPSMVIGSVDIVTALPAGSADIGTSFLYSELADQAVGLTDGSTVLLSERGGVRTSVLAISRVSADGVQLWRQEIANDSSTRFEWVAIQSRGASEVVVVARPVGQPLNSRFFAFDVENGLMTGGASVSPPGCNQFNASGLRVEPGSQAVYIIGSGPGGCAGGVLVRLANMDGAVQWIAPFPAPDFSATGFHVRSFDFEAGGDPVLLVRALAWTSQAADTLVRFNQSTGAPVWQRVFPMGSTWLDWMSLDSSAGELRVAGTNFAAMPRPLREDRISLSTGQEIASEPYQCDPNRSVVGYSGERHFGQTLAGALSCSGAGLDEPLLRTRDGWLSPASARPMLGLDGYSVFQLEPASATHAALLLSSNNPEVPYRLAQLDVAAAEVERMAPLLFGASNPIYAEGLLTHPGRISVVGEVLDEGRVRAVVASSAGESVFRDGFESGNAR